MFSVAFHFQKWDSFIENYCVMGVITAFLSPSLLLKKKNLLLTHIGFLTIFCGCLKFLPYNLPSYTEPIFANRGKPYLLLLFYFQKIRYIRVERNLKWESVHCVSYPGSATNSLGIGFLSGKWSSWPRVSIKFFSEST